MTYDYADYGIDITDAGVLRVVKRSDATVAESYDLAVNPVAFDGNQSNFGPIQVEDIETNVLDAVDLVGNSVNINTSGELCRTNNGPCRSINGKRPKFIVANDKLVIGEDI